MGRGNSLCKGPVVRENKVKSWNRKKANNDLEVSEREGKIPRWVQRWKQVSNLASWPCYKMLGFRTKDARDPLQTFKWGSDIVLLPLYYQYLMPRLAANWVTEWPTTWVTNRCTLLKNYFPICIYFLALTYWARINRDNLKGVVTKIHEMRHGFTYIEFSRG